MDKKKQIDLIRKRNAELLSQVEDLKFKIDFDTQLNMEGYKQAKDLINDLEKIKLEWLDNLEQIKEYRIQYSLFLDDLKNIKNIMLNMGFKIPIHKKIILRLKRKFSKLIKKNNL